MISRLSSRSLFLLVDACASPPTFSTVFTTASLLDPSARGEDVDEEVQRVGALDARVHVAVLAVAEVRRYREEHPAADRAAHEGLVPALDDGAGADLERRRLAAREAGVEGRLAAVDLAQVVHDDGLALLDGGTVALHERRDAQPVRGRGGAGEVEAAGHAV